MVLWELTKSWSISSTPPKTNMSPKRCDFKRKVVFQPSLLRGYVRFLGSNSFTFLKFWPCNSINWSSQQHPASRKLLFAYMGWFSTKWLSEFGENETWAMNRATHLRIVWNKGIRSLARGASERRATKWKKGGFFCFFEWKIWFLKVWGYQMIMNHSIIQYQWTFYINMIDLCEGIISCGSYANK